MKVTRHGNQEIIEMTTLEQIDDILKRLRTIENCLLRMTPVIDIAYEYEDRLTQLEKEVKAMSEKKQLKGKELDEIRGRLINYANKHYETFLQHINHLPISNQEFKAHAIFNLTQGMLWLNEAIRCSEIEVIHESNQPKENEDGQRNEDGKCEESQREESCSESACETKSEDAKAS